MSHPGGQPKDRARAMQSLAEVRANADPRPGSHHDPAANDLVVDLASSCGDFRMGVLLPVAGVPAECRSGILFSWNHVDDGWLR